MMRGGGQHHMQIAGEQESILSESLFEIDG